MAQNATGNAIQSAFVSPPPLNLVYVDNYGADPTGTRDSTAAFKRAQAAGGTSYQLVMGQGNYLLGGSGDINTFIRNQGLTGQGSACSIITYSGSGTCINALDSSFSSSASVAAPFGGFDIEGSTAGAGAVGMRMGDLLRARCHDIRIANFNGVGSIGLYGHNSAGWTEEGEWTAINLNDNTINVCFDTGSFDYSLFQFVIEAQNKQDGVRLQNNANLAGVRLEIRGNFQTGAGNTGACIAMDRGSGGTGTSAIQAAQLFINCETDGATGTGHITILQQGSSAGQLYGVGVLRFLNGTVAWQGGTFVFGAFGFGGVVTEPVLGQITNGDGLFVSGGTSLTETGSIAGFTAYNGMNIYAQAGDMQAWTLPNGAITIGGFQGTGASRRLTIMSAQPASGAAGTITWPANVKWSGGSSALSTINGTVDKIRLDYFAADGNWYGEVIKAYA